MSAEQYRGRRRASDRGRDARRAAQAQSAETASVVPVAPAAERQAPPGAAQALEWLAAGNRRFSTGTPSHPRQSVERRRETAAAAHPFAAILACSDSRLPPEIVFDQGLGDLFVVRVAGNVVGPAVIASLEMAVEAFGVPLIVVLGHDNCAAVRRTVQMLGLGARRSEAAMWTWQHAAEPQAMRPTGHLNELVAAIKPAVDQAHYRGGDVVDSAISLHIENCVARLSSAQPILAERVTRGLRIVGARYNVTTGVVSFSD